MQNRNENTTSGGITTNCVRTTENCKILHSKFSWFFKEQATKNCNKVSFHSCTFTYTSKFYLFQNLSKNTLICYNLFYRSLSSQPRHKGSYCYANMLNSRECFVRLLTVSHQWNPKSAFKYSLGQQNNVSTTLSRALSQHYVDDFEHAQT